MWVNPLNCIVHVALGHGEGERTHCPAKGHFWTRAESASAISCVRSGGRASGQGPRPWSALGAVTHVSNFCKAAARSSPSPQDLLSRGEGARPYHHASPLPEPAPEEGPQRRPTDCNILSSHLEQFRFFFLTEKVIN